MGIEIYLLGVAGAAGYLATITLAVFAMVMLRQSFAERLNEQKEAREYVTHLARELSNNSVQFTSAINSLISEIHDLSRRF